MLEKHFSFFDVVFFEDVIEWHLNLSVVQGKFFALEYLVLVLREKQQYHGMDAFFVEQLFREILVDHEVLYLEFNFIPRHQVRVKSDLLNHVSEERPEPTNDGLVQCIFLKTVPFLKFLRFLRLYFLLLEHSFFNYMNCKGSLSVLPYSQQFVALLHSSFALVQFEDWAITKVNCLVKLQCPDQITFIRIQLRSIVFYY